MTTLKKIGKAYDSFMWKVYRYLYKVEVHVFPKSPYFPAKTEVSVLLVSKFSYKLEMLWLDMDEYGHVDIQQVLVKYPGLHKLQIHYPDNWDEQLEHFHADAARTTGKHVNRYREGNHE